MSSNNNRRSANSQNNAGDDANRIRGPTSALTSFLREHGIRVENRSRREMMERRRQQREAEAQGGANDPAASPTTHDSSTTPATPTTLSGSDATNSETILYTPRSGRSRRTRSAQDQTIMDAATSSGSSTSKSKKKKRSKGDDSDSDGDSDDDYVDSQPSSSKPRATPGRIRVLFCTRCKCRFIRNTSDTSEETMCPSCVSGKEPVSDKSSKKRLHTHGGNKKAWYMHGVQTASVIPSLQDICVKVITDHIDDVEALGDISAMNMDKIAKIICRNRQLTNHTARLFMQPHIRELRLYDCANLDETGLKNIAHFCPNLRTLHLHYCGQINDEVLQLYGTHLKHLTSITLTGCHLITEKQWIEFFNTVGDRLVGFSVRHTNRFKLDSMKVLVTKCNKLQHLGLSRIVTLCDEWMDVLVKSGITTLETLELAHPTTEPGRPYTLTTAPLIKVLEMNGSSLKALILQGCSDMTDDLLVDGILPYCTQLRKLVLEGCDQVTSDAFKSLFSKDWKLRPTTIHRQPVVGLHHVALARCFKFDDDALKALLVHSGKALTHLDIHSLEKLTATALEGIAGEGDSADDDEKKTVGYSTGASKKHKRLKVGPAEDSPLACSSLVYLDTSFVRSMDDYVLAKVVRSCPSLKRINVWGCHQITDIVKLPRQLIIQGREFGVQ
ncbi:hypothetical protein [Absidia glauca]|uniref:RNI-like protein n=1 Tax=Absidia glauca TaxID=4829 RepID=A0A168SH87_ABSGL|nr:hypothetical protein [Absidia glauca]